jgi:hypothetical protein
MEDKEYELLNKMVVKINEARSYHRISTLLTLIWLFEICYSFFWIKNFGVMYFLIWVLCLIGWVSADRKYKRSMDEYKELEKEYTTIFGDEKI